MRFQPGQSGNPGGKKKGVISLGGVRAGRCGALATLDRVLAKASNKKALADALEVALLKDPFSFFRKVIMPLLPRETRTATEGAGVVGWRSLVSASVSGSGLSGDSGVAEALPVVIVPDGKPLLPEKAKNGA